MPDDSLPDKLVPKTYSFEQGQVDEIKRISADTKSRSDAHTVRHLIDLGLAAMKEGK